MGRRHQLVLLVLDVESNLLCWDLGIVSSSIEGISTIARGGDMVGARDGMDGTDIGSRAESRKADGDGKIYVGNINSVI